MLTLTIDEETLRRARIRALEQGTSVNAVVREFLQRYAEDESTIGRAAQGAVGRGADRHRLEGAGRRSWRGDWMWVSSAARQQ